VYRYNCRDNLFKLWHTIHMKRTNLVLDETLLKTATQMLGAKTYSEAVNQSLAETIRRLQVRSLTQLAGSGIWEGSLSEMRRDSSSHPKKKVK
jgi:Arc/MetJ family transcription regulator